MRKDYTPYPLEVRYIFAVNQLYLLVNFESIEVVIVQKHLERNADLIQLHKSVIKLLEKYTFRGGDVVSNRCCHS
jgi:hypothetical protein